MGRDFKLQSRSEKILAATIDGTEYTEKPKSRIEELLLELKEAIEEGGGGGGFTPTPAQRAAMNSGITAAKVAQIDTNAGDISDIQETVDNEQKCYYKLEVGGFNAHGQTMDSTTRARSKYFCSLVDTTVYFPENTKHRIVKYITGHQGQVVYNSMTDWSESTVEVITQPRTDDFGWSFKILVAYTDDRVITSDNIPDVYYKYREPKDNKMTGIDGLYVPSDTYLPAIRYGAAYMMSPIIPVKGSTTYKATKVRNVATYDSELQFMRYIAASAIVNNTITTEPNEKYLSFTWKKSDCSEMFFAEEDKFIAGQTIDNLVALPLVGKRLSLLGDSISAYAGTVPEGNDIYYTGSNSGVSDACQMWWNVLCEKTGMKLLVNNAWSGSAITQLTDSAHISKVPMSDTSRDQALHKDTTNPDVILIAGGVNDYTYAEQSSQTPGTWDGTTAPVKGNSFDETYACMIKEIQTTYPNALVVCLSTWFTMRGTDNGYTLLNGEGLTQSDYDNAIEKVARLMRVPYINVGKCGFNRSNFYPTYASDSSTIPTHPNVQGQRVMGEYIADNLQYIANSFVNQN